MIALLKVVGGLALFIFGATSLSSAMEKLAGDKIQSWLNRVTEKRLRAATFGMVATAAVQSSGLLMVSMIGLINANIMTLEQSISVMLGQEIGTTITAQIVSFDVSYTPYIFLILGFVFLEFVHKDRFKIYGQILMGLGILLVGMKTMSSELGVLMDTPQMENIFFVMSRNPIAGLLAGAIATALVQSSSATTGLVVAMGISGVITLPCAISLLLGANIGSCITGFIASLKMSRAARQASIAQISMNIIGVLLFLPFITPFAGLLELTSADLPRQIANAHTIFNIAVSAVLFPFVPQIARLSRFLVRDDKPATENKRVTQYIEESYYSIPALAISEARRELVRMGREAASVVSLSAEALLQEDSRRIDEVIHVEQDLLDPLTHEIEYFIDRLMEEQHLSSEQKERCFQLKALLIDIERLGDLAENIAQAAREKIQDQVSFSEGAVTDLLTLVQHVVETVNLAIDAFEKDDDLLASLVCQRESDFDHHYYRSRQSHIDRMNAGICSAEGNVLFTEIIRNLERISDHADNIGIGVQRHHQLMKAI